jgi:hypothetical protein
MLNVAMFMFWADRLVEMNVDIIRNRAKKNVDIFMIFFDALS